MRQGALAYSKAYIYMISIQKCIFWKVFLPKLTAFSRLMCRYGLWVY